MRSNQEELRYGTVMKLGLIPIEDGASSYVLTSSFKVNESGKFKLENEHHSGARHLSSNRDDGQCFMPPIIMHQAKEYY